MPNSSTSGNQEVQMDRRWKSRRSEDITTVEVAATPDGAAEARTFNPPRRKKQRRRQIDPTTCERDYNAEEIVFMHALDEYKRSSGRMFPTCSEILEVVRSLGYTKLTEEEQQLLDSINQVEPESDELSSDFGEDVEDSELDELAEEALA